MLPIYFRMARKAARVFIEHGALEYRECAGDDLNPKGMTTFPKTIKVKPGETVVFSWIVFKSKAHRNSVNAKVMKDKEVRRVMVIDRDSKELVGVVSVGDLATKDSSKMSGSVMEKTGPK